MNPRQFLRLEGVAVFAAALAAYVAVDGRLWLLLVLALAPDLAMLGYLAGTKVGSRVYNAVHTYVAPLALAGVAVLAAAPALTSVALVWAAHIGADRALGYGLKYPTGFGDTHLGQQNATEANASVGLDPASERRDRDADRVGSTQPPSWTDAERETIGNSTGGERNHRQ